MPEPEEKSQPATVPAKDWPGNVLARYPGMPRLSWAELRRVECELLAAVTREGSQNAT